MGRVGGKKNAKPRLCPLQRAEGSWKDSSENNVVCPGCGGLRAGQYSVRSPGVMCKNIPSLNVELVTRYGGFSWKQQAGGSRMLDPRGEEPTLGMEGWP